MLVKVTKCIAGGRPLAGIQGLNHQHPDIGQDYGELYSTLLTACRTLVGNKHCASKADGSARQVSF
jgi:hypothetical protein